MMGKHLLYVMAGIPDVTNKLEEKNAANQIIYQEYVFNYEPSMLFHFKPLMDGTKQLLIVFLYLPQFPQ
jgi:secreted protein with Ig-like and vWFA domain